MEDGGGSGDAENGMETVGGVFDELTLAVVRGTGDFTKLAGADQCDAFFSGDGVARPAGDGMRDLLAALAINLSRTYWLAARLGWGLLEKLLTPGGIRIPEMPHGGYVRFIFLLRLTPGFPMFLQNYLLGFLRVPFRLYLSVSLGCTG